MLQCLGQQFALNEASFILIRILQKYDGFELASDAQPTGSIPPPEWRHQGGRAPREKIWIAQALTMYVKVSNQSILTSLCLTALLQGGAWVRFKKAKE